MSPEEITATEMIGGKMPADLAAELRALAATNERSMAAELRRAVKAHIDAHRDEVAA